MTQRLIGKTALVTGSTSNIGRAIAQRFAQEGSRVIVSGRDEAKGAAVVTTIRESGGQAEFIRANLDGTPAASMSLAEAALAAFDSQIDILVNNAGIFPVAPTLTADEQTFDLIYGVNVKAPYFLVQALAPVMTAHGGGVIINLGSWVARLGISSSALYASTKGAMETLTRSWSAEFASQNIRVNAISPGVIRTPDLGDAVRPAEFMMHGTSAGKTGHPDDVAAAAAYLASDDAKFVHGTILDVDGGRTGVAVIAKPSSMPRSTW